MQNSTREECFGVIETALRELLEELGQEPDRIDETTLLNADLGITSIDAIHLVVLIEDAIGRPINFQELAVRDGRFADDLAVGELLDFVVQGPKLPAAARDGSNAGQF